MNSMSDPPGLNFYDQETRRTMRYVYPDTKHWAAGWLLFKHPDGQWVTLRKATENDLMRINATAELDKAVWCSSLVSAILHVQSAAKLLREAAPVRQDVYTFWDKWSDENQHLWERYSPDEWTVIARKFAEAYADSVTLTPSSKEKK